MGATTVTGCASSMIATSSRMLAPLLRRQPGCIEKCAARVTAPPTWMPLRSFGVRRATQ
jgi:hypothetical protein